MRKEMGLFIADWMNSTWINTVIFGIPIYVALYGASFRVYPIFASISSFFFQLPVQLLIFEVDAVLNPEKGVAEVVDSVGEEKSDDWHESAVTLKAQIPWTRIIWNITREVLFNPIMISIVAGVLWSLTGWTLPLFLTTICTYCGDAVTPLAAFSIGAFMYQPIPRDKMLWFSFTIQMLVKIFLMPLLVMPFLVAFGITGAPRQMGVLMAALPVALSCYVLSTRYARNEQLSSWMVIGSTVTMLPVQLMWIAITDSMGWGV